MSDLSIQQLEAVAEAYENLLVPALFAEFSHRLVEAADIQSGQHVLDVACGTGILARTIVERVMPNGSVTGVDINPAMLSVARRIAPEVEWRVGDAQALPYEDACFDIVCSQFGLMLFPSPQNALEEMARVLNASGRLAVAVFGSLDDLPAYADLIEVYEHCVNKSVADALRMPFSMGDLDRFKSLFTNPRLSSVKVSTLSVMARFPTIESMVLADIRGWFPFAGIEVGQHALKDLCQHAETALAKYQSTTGHVEFPVPVHIITARKS